MVDKAAEGQMRITFRSNGLPKATQPPNPKYPMGMDADTSDGALIACKVSLQYPAQGPGFHVIECRRCGMTAMVTCAGRIDDPRSVVLACKNTNSSSARH